MSQAQNHVGANGSGRGRNNPPPARRQAPLPPPPEPEQGADDQEEPRVLPVQTVRLGRVKVTIWANYTKENKAFYSAVPGRTYLTEDGYATATSFDRGDLLTLAEACRQAFLWMSMNPPNVNEDADRPY